MSIEKANRIVRLALPTMATLVFLANPMEGNEIMIVSPSPWANVDGDGGTGPQLISAREQQVFSAQDFMGLPVGNRVLTAFVMRSDANFSGNGEWAATSFWMRMSTTEQQVGGLSYSYEANWGDDLTTVYEGDITIHQTHSGPAGGPKDFDDATPLQTPFVYDPNAGNLLVDWEFRNMQSSGTVSWDIIHDTNQNFTQIIWGDVDASSAHSSVGGLIWQFTFVSQLAADFDADGDVDGDDFLAWQTGFGTQTGAQKSDGDYDNDGDVDGDDFLGWQAEFGSASGAASAAVPEPAAALLVMIIVSAVACFQRCRRAERVSKLVSA